jgi:translocation and assembly module TamA
MRFFGLILILFTLISCAHGPGKSCSNIIFEDGEFSLTRNEQVLVCGADKNRSGWKDVPLPQAEYQLSVFLQRDGYLHPRFERLKDILHVWRGPLTEIHKFTINGADGTLDSSRKRKVIGSPLRSDKLDEISQWADMSLRSSGYACPEIEVSAQAWDAEVIVDVKTGEKQTFGKTTRAGFESIEADTFDRYMAYKPGQTYDVTKTQLTSSRLLSDGLVQSANFKTSCVGQHVDLLLKGSVGPPRVFRFEIGGSTEQFPFGSITFKNSRLDSRASSFTTTLFASPRLQSLDVSSQLYVIPWSRRLFLGPRFSVARASERAYEYLDGKLGIDVGRFGDYWESRWIARFGPTINYVKTLTGVGPEVGYLSFDGGLQGMSHSYEAGTRTQYTGWMGQFNYRSQRRGLGSQINVDRYDFNYKLLWNINNFSPPLFVLGSRFEVTAVDSGQVQIGDGKDILPQNYRVFYGGGDNLRGFARKSLANLSLGYLTSAYAGFELRLVEQIRWNIQPFLLYDIAKLGSSRFTLDEPLFTSSGVGIRWPSPFGTVRGSAAKGQILNGNATTSSYAEEWVYFFSFGQEF